MRFNGKWLDCRDGIHRPVVDGALLDPDGVVQTFPFLIDTGADATVLSYWAVTHTGLETEHVGSLEGVGGSIPTVAVPASFWLLNNAGTPTRFGGRLLGRAQPVGDEMCILGRDLLGHFALIIDRPGRAVILLSHPHHYVVQEA